MFSFYEVVADVASRRYFDNHRSQFRAKTNIISFIDIFSTSNGDRKLKNDSLCSLCLYRTERYLSGSIAS